MLKDHFVKFPAEPEMGIRVEHKFNKVDCKKGPGRGYFFEKSLKEIYLFINCRLF